jgi:hypothetical protein
MVAAMRALTQVSMDLSPDLQARRPDIAQYCNSLSLVHSIEDRMLDVKAARSSATRVWWPQIAMMLKWWRRSGAKWGINDWRRVHVERREKNSSRWAPADWGNVIADVVAGQGSLGSRSGAATGGSRLLWGFNSPGGGKRALDRATWTAKQRHARGDSYTGWPRLCPPAAGLTAGSSRGRTHRNLGRPASHRQRG